MHDPDVDWLYIIGRLKPGVSPIAFQQKLSALLRQMLAPSKHFSTENDKVLLAKAHVVLTPGGQGIQDGAG